MCFFWRKKKKQKALAQKQAEAEKTNALKEEKVVTTKKEEPVVETAKPKEKVAVEKKKPVLVAPGKKTAEQKVEAGEAKEPTPVKNDKANERYSGKYEIFPEAGLFKYRLKASNGEILLVSGGYTSRSGAEAGIETLKKNISLGKGVIVKDKNGFAQFRIYTTNGARVILAGEFYDREASAEKALASTEKFASTDKIIQLDDIPTAEVREEIVESQPVETNGNGKIEIKLIEDKKYQAVLKASNGEVLFVTDIYASKATVLKGIEAIKNGIVEKGVFRINRDKQNRYQFKLYSSINQVLVVGETYSSKEAALSAVESVRRFIKDAKVIDA
ncbi:MAG TPA: YegP family protein [Bacilli bacterium]|nr:YegP family protein [Bacilli bacterium]